MPTKHAEIEAIWRSALGMHSKTPMQGPDGPSMPIGQASRDLLEGLWAIAPAAVDFGAEIRAGRDVRFFGDPHFEHANIIRLCGRPHADGKSMDEALWVALAEASREADRLVCLGDWAVKGPLAWARRAARELGAPCATIVGNHDARDPDPERWAKAGAMASAAFSIDKPMAEAWARASEPEIADLVDWQAVPDEIFVGLSHWPLPPERLPGPGWICLHGHTHHRGPYSLCANASMEAIGYKPARLSELIGARLCDELALRERGLHALPIGGADLATSGY